VIPRAEELVEIGKSMDLVGRTEEIAWAWRGLDRVRSTLAALGFARGGWIGGGMVGVGGGIEREIW
jgi:hypothetical protein